MIDDDALADQIPYYDRRGRLITRKQLDVLLADHDYRRVAYDHFDDLLVSTMWRGVDFTFGRGPRRLIFETVVLAPDGTRESALSATEEEALASHRALAQEYAFRTYEEV